MPSFPLGPRTTLSALILKFLRLGAMAVAAAASAHAQAPSVTYSTFTPTPGVGHDYVGMLAETVNPANGSVSVRINLPVPSPGRGPTIPFGFGYDSNYAFVVPGVPGQASWAIPSTPWSKGGWSFLVATLSEIQGQVVVQTNPQVTCGWWGDFFFTAPNGTRNGLGLALGQQTADNGNSCPTYSTLSNIGDFFQAFIPSSAYYYENSPDPPPITISDGDGTIYYFGNLLTLTSFSGVQGGLISLPSFIEDRNGNKVTFDVSPSSLGVFSIVDAAGRTIVSTTGFGQSGNQVAISGISGPFKTNWGSASNPSWNLGPVNLDPGDVTNCKFGFPANSGLGGGIQSIVLPNGQSFQFLYDSTYGLLKQIVYPSGGTVTYTWEVNPQSQTAAWPDSGTDPNPIGCMYRYGTPAIATRVVSFDGKTNALQQTFQYSPVTWSSADPLEWTTMSTTVTTTDLVSGASFATVYNYVPRYGTVQPHDMWTLAPAGVPVETTVLYYKDTNTSGSPIQTVAKNWLGPGDLLACQLTTLDNGSIFGAFYKYSGDLVTDKKEYDFGQFTSNSSCLTSPIAPSSPAPARETVATPQTFLVTPIYPVNPSILDRPSTVKTYLNGTNGTLISETDYSYDQAAVASVSNMPTGTHDETNYPSSVISPRGNATTIVEKCLQAAPACSSTNPTSTYTYDETGQVLSMTDPCGNTTCSDMSGTNHTTSYSYADSYVSGDTYTSGTPSGSTNAYLTQITYPPTNGISHIENSSYDYPSGQLTVSKDQNGQTTKYHYNDLLARPTETDYPDGGQTLVTYNDVAPTPSITTKKLISSGNYLTSVSTMDGIGHVTNSQITSDPDGTDTTVTSYNGLGRPYTVTNPYRSGNTIYSTTYVYDALSRTTMFVPPDGTIPSGSSCPSNDVCTTYSGNTTTVIDEAGHSREWVIDGLGRITEAIENPGGLGYQTNYTYDSLNDLTSVVQNGSRQRTFAYNSLAQLTSSINPESNTTPSGTTVATTYSYDLNGNLTQKTAPAQNQQSTTTVTLSYCYDALNRMTGKAYTAQTTCPLTSPVATYLYDQTSYNGLTITNGIGRRTGMSDAAGGEAWSYDVMGRVLTDQRTTNSITKSTITTYLPYVDGSINTLQYPSGRTLTLTTGGAERLLSVVDSPDSISYASAAHYAAQGDLASLTNGSNLYSTYIFNSRLQPCWIYVTTGTPLATTTVCTTPDPGPANILDLNYNFNLGVGDNGNVMGITNNRDTMRSQSFAYDALNRLLTGETTSTYATSPSHCWGESYQYDNQATGGAWGNLTNIGAVSTSYNGCTQESLSATVNAQNQLSTNGYDTAGNATSYGTDTYSYSAENQMTQAVTFSTTNYAYDGDGKRVEKVVGGLVTKIYWYNSGNILDETDGTGSLTNSSFSEYVFFGGQRIARRDSSGDVFYYASDHLGTSRAIAEVPSGQTTATLCYDADFYPFGGERPYTTTCTQNYKFTGKERDSESVLDNFGARYNLSSVGRFMTPDPSGLSFADASNPQSLNLYAYVQNNPLAFVDPNGLNALPAGRCQWFLCLLSIIGDLFRGGGTEPQDSPFQNLWSHYPRYDQFPSDPQKGHPTIWEHAGGHVQMNEKIFGNSCVIRMCEALNQSGYKIPHLPSTVSDSKHDWNFHLLKDLQPFLIQNFGKPEVYVTHGSNTWRKQLAGRTGILMFKVNIWQDATGHITLWNGKNLVDDVPEHDYTPLASEVRFWPIQ